MRKIDRFVVYIVPLMIVVVSCMAMPSREAMAEKNEVVQYDEPEGSLINKRTFHHMSSRYDFPE